MNSNESMRETAGASSLPVPARPAFGPLPAVSLDDTRGGARVGEDDGGANQSKPAPKPKAKAPKPAAPDSRVSWLAIGLLIVIIAGLLWFGIPFVADIRADSVPTIPEP